MKSRNATSVVLGFPDYREPAHRLAGRARIGYGDIGLHHFPDGESLVRLPETLPPDVILYGSFDNANQRLIETELAAATAIRLGAKRLTLVAPYLCYMRQDIAFRPGEAVSQRIIGELLGRHFDTVITVDPHLHRTHELADIIPVRRAVALSAAPLMAAWLARQGGEPLLLGPDEESEQWVSAIAAPGAFEYAVARKIRLDDDQVRVDLPDTPFVGRKVVLVDDVVSTGRTLAEAASAIRARGAASVSAVVTHALFSKDAQTQLSDAGISDLCSTDSIRHASNRLHLDTLLAAALDDE